MFDERKFTGPQCRQRSLVEIIDVHRQARLGKGEHKRNSHVPGTTHNSDIGGLCTGRGGRRRFGGCDIQLDPLSPEWRIS